MNRVAFTINGFTVYQITILIAICILSGITAATYFFNKKRYKSALIAAVVMSVVSIILSAQKNFLNKAVFTVGTFDVYWYAIIIVIGMLTAMAVGAYLLKRKGYQPDLIMDISLLALPLAIVGARLYYVLTTLNRNWKIDEIINIRTGGLAIYGGIIGGVIGASIVIFLIKKMKISNFLDLADAIFPGIILAQAIGRWGNFFNQEAYGNLVTNPALQFFPYSVYIEEMRGYYQATFFYESFCNVIGFVLLFILSYRLNGKYKGLVLCGYCVYYGIVRAFVEGLRSDSLYIGNYRISQVLSVILIAAGLAAAVHIILKNRNNTQVKGNTNIKQ